MALHPDDTHPIAAVRRYSMELNSQDTGYEVYHTNSFRAIVSFVFAVKRSAQGPYLFTE